MFIVLIHLLPTYNLQAGNKKFQERRKIYPCNKKLSPDDIRNKNSAGEGKKIVLYSIELKRMLK